MEKEGAVAGSGTLPQANISAENTAVIAGDGYFSEAGVCETLGRAWNLLRRQWKVLLSITTAAYFTIYAINWLTLLLFVWLSGDYVTAHRQGMLWHMSNPSASQSLLLILENFVFYLIMCISDGAVIRAVAEIYVGYSPTIQSSAKKGMERVFVLFCSCFVIGMVTVGFAALVMMVGMILLYNAQSRTAAYYMYVFLMMFIWVFVVIVTVVTYHTYPAIMIEYRDTIGSIKRSIDLSKDYRGYIFLVLLSFGAIKFFTGFFFLALGYPSDIGGGGAFKFHTTASYSNNNDNYVSSYGYYRPGADYYIVQCIQVVLTIVFACYGSILQAVVYMRVRSSKEGLNLGILTQEIGMSNEENAYEMMAAGGSDDRKLPVAV